MDALVGLLGGFGDVLTPTNLMYVLIGALIGTAVGVLPGLGSSMAVALLLLWPAQILRLWRRDGDGPRAALLTIAKIPEALGAFQYLFARLFRRKARLIEYK